MADISSLRFLVVEDHGFQQWHCCNVLQQLGATQVVAAGDGMSALAHLDDSSGPFDVVITDLNMPGMDGMALIRRIAERRLQTSLIIVSSVETPLLASVEAMAKAYGVRLIGSISKPVTARKLRALLDGYKAPVADTPGKVASFSAEEISGGLQRGEFETFFQPKVDLITRQVKGAEALVRWQHPQRGLVGPGAFIAAAEAGGLIDALTWRVLQSATENCHAWREAGLDAGVAVNLSVASLDDVTLSERLIELAGDVGLDSHHLVLEITESIAAGDLGRKLENLSRLRMRGFGLSIDDYGTGYSSMERLSLVPFTELKIDQRFVREAATKPSSRALVEASLELAKKLGIGAVAEGVESHGEWELLLSLGCPVAQGYYIARPMPAVEFGDWVKMRGRASA